MALMFFALSLGKSPLKFGAQHPKSPLKFGADYQKTPFNFGAELLNLNKKQHNKNNLTVPSSPLAISKIDADFKLFYADIGMLLNILGYEAVQGVVLDTLGMNKGYIYECAVAESMYKAGMPLYYFAKNSGLKVDFVTSIGGHVTLVEVKARNGNAKSSKTIMGNPEHYGKTKLLKIGDYNIGETGDVLTIPHYMIFALPKIA